MKKTLISLMLASSLTLTGCSSITSLVAKPDNEKTVEDFYGAATAGFSNKQWDIAITNYEKLKAYYPYGPYAEQSHLELAYAYYRYDEAESAILELEEFIRLYPRHKELDYAYFLRALAADSIIRSWLDNFITDPATRDVKSAKRAYRYYNDVISKFPDSKYTVAASKRIVILSNQMARSELHVAQYYFDRKAYLASANRAKYILENYPQSASTIDAIQLMTQAYSELGMTQIANDAIKVYELNSDAKETASDVSFGASNKANKSVEKEDSSWWSNIIDSIGSIFD